MSHRGLRLHQARVLVGFQLDPVVGTGASAVRLASGRRHDTRRRVSIDLPLCLWRSDLRHLLSAHLVSGTRSMVPGGETVMGCTHAGRPMSRCATDGDLAVGEQVAPDARHVRGDAFPPQAASRTELLQNRSVHRGEIVVRFQAHQVGSVVRLDVALHNGSTAGLRSTASPF
jgi:hypothetical protein